MFKTHTRLIDKVYYYIGKTILLFILSITTGAILGLLGSFIYELL